MYQFEEDVLRSLAHCGQAGGRAAVDRAGKPHIYRVLSVCADAAAAAAANGKLC